MLLTIPFAFRQSSAADPILWAKESSFESRFPGSRERPKIDLPAIAGASAWLIGTDARPISRTGDRLDRGRRESVPDACSPGAPPRGNASDPLDSRAARGTPGPHPEHAASRSCRCRRLGVLPGSRAESAGSPCRLKSRRSSVRVGPGVRFADHGLRPCCVGNDRAPRAAQVRSCAARATHQARPNRRERRAAQAHLYLPSQALASRRRDPAAHFHRFVRARRFRVS